MAYGSNMGTRNFDGWLPLNDYFNESRIFCTILQVGNDLPAFHIWQIHKSFPENPTSKSTLWHNYQVLTGYHSPAASKAQAEKQRQIAILVSEQDEEEILPDLPLLNGKPNSPTCWTYLKS